MRYVLLLAHDPGAWADTWADNSADTSADTRAEQEGCGVAHAAFDAYVEAHGRRRSCATLADAETATTVHRAGERAVMTDGPLAGALGGGVQLGGYYDIDVPDLDAAITAAALLPAAYTVEIRPVVTSGGSDTAGR